MRNLEGAELLRRKKELAVTFRVVGKYNVTVRLQP
jgi:hypothetical protein